MFAGAVGQVHSFGGAMAEAGSKLMEWVGVGAAIEVGRAAVDHLAESIKSGFEVAEKIENAQIAMTGLAGSAENATAIITHLKNLSVSSGLGFDELTAATKKLMAIGVSAEKIEPLIRSIGDVAAGTGASLSDMAEVFVKAEGRGSITAKELKSLTAQGIPIVAELARQFGTTAEGVKQLAANGQIGFAQLQKAFESMSGPGGRFAGLMDQQANTVGGVWKRIATSIGFSSAEIIMQLEEAFDLRGILQSVMTAIPVITTYITNGITLLTPYLQMAEAWIFRGLGAVWDTIKGPLATAFNFIAGILPAIPDLIGSAMGYCWEIIQSVWGSIWGFIGPIVTAIYDVIATNWEAIVETTVGFVMAVVNVFESVFTACYGIAQSIWDGIVTIWNEATAFITGRTADAANANVTAFTSMYDMVSWFVNGLKDLLNAAAFTLNHWQDAAEIVGLEVMLAFITLGNQLEYVFTTVIPYAINYGVAYLKDFGGMTTTIIKNILANILMFVESIPGLLTGELSFRDVVGQFAPITEAFASEMKKLPAMAARVPGDMEKAMTGELNHLEGKFAEGLGGYLNGADEKAHNAAKKITDALNAGLNNVKHPKDLGLGFSHKDLNPVIRPTVNNDDLHATLHVELKLGKLTRWGSAQALAQQSEIANQIRMPLMPGVNRPTNAPPTRPGATPAKPATATPANSNDPMNLGWDEPTPKAIDLNTTPSTLGDWGTPAAPAAPRPAAAIAPKDDKPATGSTSPLENMAALMAEIRRYIVKWDSNPPLAEVNM